MFTVGCQQGREKNFIAKTRKGEIAKGEGRVGIAETLNGDEALNGGLYPVVRVLCYAALAKA